MLQFEQIRYQNSILIEVHAERKVHYYQIFRVVTGLVCCTFY